MQKSIYFHVEHIYYLPQFTPVLQELKNKNYHCVCLFNNTIPNHIIKSATKNNALNYEIYRSDEDALTLYQEKKPTWIIFGNNFKYIDQLNSQTKTAMLYHGIGVKDCYYDAKLNQMDVRFVEGPYRAKEILKRTPNANIITTGFAKLDPVFNDETKNTLPEQLDTEKKTILYAPTFYPSTIENIPANWPADFRDFNLIIKPHEFSLTNNRYIKQRKRINEWKKFSNVYIASADEYSLLPFMQQADLLISEASSALFEFAALDKPIIWCDFIKLRWRYRGIFNYRYKRRMDMNIMKYSHVAAHASTYKDMLTIVKNELNHPETHAAERSTVSNELLGNIDGKAAQRVVDYLVSME